MKQTKPIERTKPFNQSTDISRLVLGTAQLGMAYGVANRLGKPAYRIARKIVSASFEGGIREFDTAQAYGASQKVVGRALSELDIVSKVRVITKLDPGLDYTQPLAIQRAAESCIEKLGGEALYCVMLHNESLMDEWDGGLSERMRSLVAGGWTEKIGISVYSPDRARQALESVGLDVVQLPTNALDRRAEQAGVFDLAEGLGKSLYVRSVFLQGALVMEPDFLEGNIENVKPYVAKFQGICKLFGLTPAQAALVFVRDIAQQHRVLFGAETPEQVKKNIEVWGSATPADALLSIGQAFNEIPEELIDPRRW